MMKPEIRDPFGLSGLPDLQPPSDAWNGIASQLQQAQRRRQRWLTGLAVAASMTLVLGVVLIIPKIGPPSGLQTGAELASQEKSQQPAVPQADKAIEPDPIAETTPDPASENLRSLQKLSQRLEQNLSYLRTGQGAVPAEMVVYQVELEDLVAQLDAAISRQPDATELWRQRVNLLMDLNQIYGAGLRRDEPYVASL